MAEIIRFMRVSPFWWMMFCSSEDNTRLCQFCKVLEENNNADLQDGNRHSCTVPHNVRAPARLCGIGGKSEFIFLDDNLSTFEQIRNRLQLMAVKDGFRVVSSCMTCDSRSFRSPFGQLSPSWPMSLTTVRSHLPDSSRDFTEWNCSPRLPFAKKVC
jgi:hypothetical protein